MKIKTDDYWKPVTRIIHTRGTVNLYAVGVQQKINLTCLGGPVDRYKQTRGGQGY